MAVKMKKQVHPDGEHVYWGIAFEVETINEASIFRGRDVEVSAELPDAGYSLRVTVHGETTHLSGPVRGVTINWPAVGSVSAKDAAIFGKLMCFAAAVGEHIEGALS